MDTRLFRLREPITVCGTTIKNRIVVPPMADFGMTEGDGLINERHVARYGSYADGGAGLVIIEACAVSNAREGRGIIGLYSDKFLPGLEKLAAASRRNGAAALVQLKGPELDYLPEGSLEALSRQRFMGFAEDFLTAAIRCQKAGFHGVELHAAHGMYLDEILEGSRRYDEYGGAFENRVRLLVELIGKIKSACGRGFIVAVRFGNPNLQELVKTAAAIQKAGADLLDVSTGKGAYRNLPAEFPFDDKIYAASLVKERASLPVIGVGGISSGEQAEAVLAAGYADMIAVGRGHLCDPGWANQVLAGQQPEPCRNCRRCMWYWDGRKCPAALKRSVTDNA